MKSCEKTNRERAMDWWNNKSFAQKWDLVVKYKNTIMEATDRGPDALTGSEIEKIWTLENPMPIF